jgi:tetratricopeptide (TPR) repeat protein
MREKIVVILVGSSVLALATSRAQDAKFAADSLKYSHDSYAKVHLVAIANLDFGDGGTVEFKYDRYPNGGPERIQAGNGEEFAWKDGKTWLKSTGCGDTGKPVDAQTAKRLNNWVSLIDGRLNGEPVSNDASEGATVLKFIGKEDKGDREEVVFEESKEKPKAGAYPRLTLRRYNSSKNEQALLSHFSGPMRLGTREANVDLSFSYLIALKVQETGHESPSPASPAAEGSSADLINRGIEKEEKGDLDGAIADFSRAIELDPKAVCAYFNRAYAKDEKGVDPGGIISDLTRAIELSPKDFDSICDNRFGAAPVYRTRAVARIKKGDIDGAIADCNHAIELVPSNNYGYYDRGIAKKTKGDLDGAIDDFTSAIEISPDWADAYKERAEAKQAKDDAIGAAEDFKRAQKLDPKLVSEGSAADSSSNRSAATGEGTGTPASLLDGKLKLDVPSDFSRDADDPKTPKTVAKFSGPDGAWGEVLRGTHGLTPNKLDGYLKMRVAEYSKGFNWLPKDSHLQWLKKDIVTIDGRKWADWRYVPMLKGTKDYLRSPVYTRFLTTSYKGQLLEVTFTSNLNTAPELKQKIDHVMGSVHLEE